MTVGRKVGNHDEYSATCYKNDVYEEKPEQWPTFLHSHPEGSGTFHLVL
jgi:hypothetical protein